jgi:hypothetical protein
MPSRQIVAPIPVSPSKRSGTLEAPQDLYISLNDTLATKSSKRSSTPQVDDYTVPAPPPPSPVSFRPEHWPTSIRC